MDLDDDPVGADRRGRARERLDEPAVARRVARVDDHRQVRVQLEPRDRAEVEREARRGLERADAALAQDHALVALLEHVVGGHQQLVERGREPALEQHRLAELARDLEQRVVLHVARADLDHVGVLGDQLGVRGVEQLGDDGQPGLRARLGEDLQPGRAEALERERRRARLERAAAQHAARRPRRPCARRRASARATRPCTARRSARTCSARRSCGRRRRRRSARGGRARRRRACRAARSARRGRRRPSPRGPARDALGVADRADRGGQLARQDEHVHAGRLEPRADRRDLGLAGLGCHHDHHRPELADAELVGAEVVRQLVAHRPRDLRAQLVRVVAEVAQQRVAEDDDAVGVRRRARPCRPGRGRRRGGGGPCRRSRPRRGRARAAAGRAGRRAPRATSSSKSAGLRGSSSMNSPSSGSAARFSRASRSVRRTSSSNSSSSAGSV